jgi:hypothetical protein
MSQGLCGLREDCPALLLIVQDGWSGWGSAPGAELAAQEEAQVSGFRKAAIGIAVVGVVLMIFNFWLGLIVLVAGIAIPVGAYLMLDPSQRRRLRDIRRRQIDH